MSDTGPHRSAASRSRRPGARLGSSWRIATIRGIDVAIHPSWLLIAALVTWSLATGWFAVAIPAGDVVQDWLLGSAAAVLLFASVLLHELAHSFVARARGLDVRSITLFVFGGVSNLSGEAKAPMAEFQIAIVGPLTSFAIAAVAFGVASLVSGAPPIEATATYLFVVNAALGVFNLVPGFPLDGGRVLRSIVWSLTKDIRRATAIAAGLGRVIGWLMILYGLWRLVQGDAFGGVWIVAIGWFLANAAGAALSQSAVDARIDRLTVGDVVSGAPVTIAPAASIAALLEQFMAHGGGRAVAVVEGDAAIGIVTLDDIRRLPPAERTTSRVADIMTGGGALPTVAPETPLRIAVDAFASGDVEHLPVVENGRLVGVLGRAEVLRAMQAPAKPDVPGRPAVEATAERPGAAEPVPPGSPGG
jgi:Zn-dependent protease/CBS domain-containing protein